MLETASLTTFLNDCLEVAKAKQSPQIASISLPFKEIDFIHCIPNGFHCYIEKKETQEAVLAIGALAEASYEGPNRFKRSKQFCEEILENTHYHTEAIHQAPSDFRIFSGFTFFPHTTCTFSPFKPATLFIPKIQLSKKQALFTLTINLLVDPAFTKQKLHAIFNETLDQAKNAETTNSDESNSTSYLEIKETGDASIFEKNAALALKNIESKKYQKIVLARALNLKRQNGNFDLKKILNTLKRSQSNCYIFSFNAGRSSSFIGASPERIFKKDRSSIETEAIAGSKPRSSNNENDEALEKELINNPKERLEQDLIIANLVDKFKTLGLQPYYKKEPSILKLSNLQHLHTSITANLDQPLHPLEILETLHPTPAVGGTPFEAVQEDIQTFEPFDRNLYAGPIGWINFRGESEFIVGIRSGIIDGNQARIYAGAGIVKSSNPEKEKEETNLKFEGLLCILR